MREEICAALWVEEYIEGFEIGVREAQREVVYKILHAGLLTPEKLAEILELPLSEVQEIADNTEE